MCGYVLVNIFMNFYYSVVRFGLWLVITIRWFSRYFYGFQTDQLISERISNILPTVCCAVVTFTLWGYGIAKAFGEADWLNRRWGDPSILRKVNPFHRALRNYVNTHRQNRRTLAINNHARKEVARYCESVLKKYFQLIKATYWFQSHFYWPVNMISCGWRRERSLLGKGWFNLIHFSIISWVIHSQYVIETQGSIIRIDSNPATGVHWIVKKIHLKLEIIISTFFSCWIASFVRAPR